MTPVITNRMTYDPVVKRRNDPRRLNSSRCDLDSIRLLNISILPFECELRSSDCEFLEQRPSTTCKAEDQSPLVAGAIGSRELTRKVRHRDPEQVPGWGIGLRPLAFGLWSWGLGRRQRPKAQGRRPKPKD